MPVLLLHVKVAERLKEILQKNPRKQRPLQRKSSTDRDPSRTFSGKKKRGLKDGKLAEDSNPIMECAKATCIQDDDVQLVSISPCVRSNLL